MTTALPDPIREPVPGPHRDPPAGGLPDAVPVSAVDWFLTAFDRAMRRSTGAGNVCHLVVELDTTLTAETLRAEADTALLDWLASLRMVRTRWLAVPQWARRGAPGVAVREHAAGDDTPLDTVLVDTCSVFDDPPVWLELVHRPAGTSLVLSWHHALMDAVGAEVAVQALGGRAPAPRDQLAVAPTPARGGWLTRLLQARMARNFVFLLSLGRVATVGTIGRRPGARSRDHRLELSPDEVTTSDGVAQASGAGVFRSLFYLAVVSRALDEVLRARGGPARDFLVPVPQNRRRRGVLAPVLSNQLSMLFYRLKPADRASVATTVRALSTQLKALMAVRMPDAVQVLLEMCRRLPLWALWGVVSLPSGGRVATLGFSDTGDGLDRVTTFAGREVVRAWHVPANIHPPGFQVVVSRQRGRLEVCTSYVDGMLSDDELHTYAATVRRLLLTAEADG